MRGLVKNMWTLTEGGYLMSPAMQVLVEEVIVACVIITAMIVGTIR